MSEKRPLAADLAFSNDGWGITRGPNVGWQVNLVNREFGRIVAEDLRKVLPMASDQRIISAAAQLAMQEPPVPLDQSWQLYDGVRDFLEDERVTAAFTAQHAEGVEA